MNTWIEALLKRKEQLLALEPSAVKWAEEEGLSYAFNQAGDLIVLAAMPVFFTTDGALSSETYWNGKRKDILSGASAKRPVLCFIPASLTFEAYKNRPHLFRGEFPLPEDFIPEEIHCEHDIFIISCVTGDSTPSGQNALCGTFSVFQIALSMIESLYLNQGISEEILCKCYYEFLPEDHQSFLARQEKEQKQAQKRKIIRQSPFIRAEDFSREGSEYTWEGELPLWGEQAELYFDYLEEEEDEETESPGLKAAIQLLNQHLEWIEQHKTELFYAILEDDMARLACDWMDGFDTLEQEGKTYYVLEDGKLFPCPVTNQSLFDSLYLEGMNASYYEKGRKPEHILFDMFFGTDPDFFACHSIEVFLTAYSDGRYEIQVNGLAG